jgi:hypothetical protein
MTTPTESVAPATVALLTVAFDGDDHVLGRPDLGVFVAVPEPGAVFVKALQEGATVAEASARAGAVAGTDVDGADFVDGLAAAGLFDPAPAPTVTDGGRRVRWVAGLRPHTAARLFGWPTWWCAVAAGAFAALVLAVRPDLRPSWADLWFLSDPVLSLLAFVPISIALRAAHEAGHWAAGRALGVPAAFRLSYRGAYVVFETDLTQIVTVPRRRRYGAFLAGMAIDVIVLAVALGLRLAHRTGRLSLPETVDGLLGAVVLTQVFAIVWQWAAVPLRSDGYAVLANALRCHNLYRVTWLTVLRRLGRLGTAEHAELAAASDHDRRIARWFAVVYVAGIAGMCWLLGAYLLPYLVAMARWTGHHLFTGAIDTVRFWEAAGLLAYLLLQYGLPPVLALRERRLRRAGRLL